MNQIKIDNQHVSFINGITSVKPYKLKKKNSKLYMGIKEQR
jgi:hypothetical protein